MPKNNPSNSHDTNEADVMHTAPMPVQRARVTDARTRVDGRGAVHTATIRVFGDPSPYEAVVLTPSSGDVNAPVEGDDVAVVFGANEQPFIIGFWYAADKVADGDTDLPDYVPGERYLGTPLNESSINIQKDGTIAIVTDGDSPVNIDHNSFVAYMGSDQSVAGDGNYDILQFDTEEDDPEDLFDTATYTMTVKHDGRYQASATVEIGTSGQNNLYQLAIFVNGAEEKRKSRQSVVNEPLSLDVELNKRLDEGDEVDVRLAQDSGSAKTVQGSSITTDFTAERYGI